MPTRRTVLRGAMLAAAGVPLGAFATRQAARAADRLPITIVNQTNKYANSAIWVYIVGTDRAAGSATCARTARRCRCRPA